MGHKWQNRVYEMPAQEMDDLRRCLIDTGHLIDNSHKALWMMLSTEWPKRLQACVCERGSYCVCLL